MKKLNLNITTLVILALVINLGGLSCLAYFRTRGLLISNLEMNISSLTSSSATEVGLWLDNHKTEIQTLANNPSIYNENNMDIKNYLTKETESNNDFSDLFVTGRNGQYIVNTNKTTFAANPDYFQELMKTGKTVVSNPLKYRGNNQCIVITSPILKQKTVVGLLGGIVDVADLTKLVTTEKIGQGGYAFIVQGDGQIITQSNQEFAPSANALKENNLSLGFKDAIFKMTQGETGVTKISLLKNDNYLAFAPVPGANWSLGVAVPVSYVTNQMRYLPVEFIALTIFFGLILVFALNRWLVRPLTKLAGFTSDLNNNFQEADLNKLKGPVAEVQSLASNFQRMATKLRENFTELENSNASLEAEIMDRNSIQEDLEKSNNELELAQEKLRDNYNKLQIQEQSLRESERRFRSLLENVDLITGIIDREGKIIFCNDFMLRLTGYTLDEVIGKNHFELFMPEEIRNKLFSSFIKEMESKGIRFNGTYPIKTKNGEYRLVHWNNTLLYDLEGNVSGVASVGEDVTERKQFQNKLQYMSFHDSLTGLYNRTYFEEQLRLLEDDRYAPVGMIICDVDGLKLVNDTLGHSTGDKLLSLTAELIRRSFREGDLLFRIGGDEFAVILPNSELSIVEQACHRIRKSVQTYNDENEEFPLSLSLGFAVGAKSEANISEVFKEADDGMYREKLHRSKSTRSALVQALMKALEVRDFITEGHADRLQSIVAALGKALNLPERNLADLRLLAQFHDIGKVGIPDRILFKPGHLTSDEFKEMQRHSEIGHRIAQSAPDLSPIAEHILKHHEWWNGKGYPLGLKGEEIPLECRILSIADAYDAMTSNRPYRKALSQDKAFAELTANSGIQFDPKLVPIFIKVMRSQVS
jgi:diguanylate cyclase (GGDEF)-like protein/PAS domain S-box-containing protein